VGRVADRGRRRGRGGHGAGGELYSAARLTAAAIPFRP
jgi:hypothetical protein